MIKKIAFLLFFGFIILSVRGQEIPDIKLFTMEGENFQTQKLNEFGNKPVVLSFWATWCIPCLNELSAINDHWDEWKKKTQFEFYAISEDDSRSVGTVSSLIHGKDWPFKVLIDENQEFERELNLANIPYTLVIKNKKIIYKKSGYVSGNENELYSILKNNQ